MALFQPSNIIPDSLTGWGLGVIDATDDLTVSWQINGQSAMTAYEIKFFSIDSSDGSLTQLYDTGTVTISPAVYGTDSTGAIQYFSATPITAATLSSNGIVNDDDTDYCLQLTLSYIVNGVTETVEQTRYSGFNCYAAPTITLGALTDPLTTKNATFTATYAQTQGRAMNWFRWYIADKTNPAEPFFDSGEITGSGNITCSYDGFFSRAEKYSVKCVIETEDGVQADTGWNDFTCAYSTTVAVGGSLTVCQMADRSALKVEWPNLPYIPGSQTGTVMVSGGKLELDAGEYVTWNTVSSESMAFAPNWNILWKGKFDNLAATLTAFTVEGGNGEYLTAQLTGTGTAWEIINHNGTLATFDVSSAGHIGASSDITWTIGIQSNGTITIRGQRPGGGLLPQIDLYPSTTLYPDGIAGTLVEVQTEDANETYWEEFVIEAVYAPDNTGAAVDMTIDYLWITQSVDPALWVQIFPVDDSAQPEPVWTAETYFLANFTDDSGIGAGILTANDSAANISLYRQQQGSGVLKFLATVDITQKYIYDYGAASNTAYKYLMFPVGSNTFLTADALESPWITPLFWDWTILTANVDNNGVYVIDDEYDFSCNVVSSAVSNNNAPALLENFTPYPLRQGKNTNYRTGTLQALIGSISSINTYYDDTAAKAAALYALSSNTQPKFLKDRKGNVIRVETYSATTMQAGDHYVVQPQTISLSWVEVADASNMIILGHIS